MVEGVRSRKATMCVFVAPPARFEPTQVGSRDELSSGVASVSFDVIIF